MFKIKICGITTPADALLAADAGADAIGLNFYQKSPRYVEVAQAIRIAGALISPIERVGVFVETELLQIQQIVNEVGLTAVQLHENPTDPQLDRVAALDQIVPHVIQVFRLPDPDWQSDELMMPIAGFLDGIDIFKRCRRPTVLLDTYRRDQLGGTGQQLDWKRIARERGFASGTNLILAGGLTPDNVAEAIRTARPDAVDVASGVESSPGKKDSAKVRDFVAAAKQAFSEINSSPPNSAGDKQQQ